MPASQQYTYLSEGDTIRVGDEIYTWADPECTARRWIMIPPKGAFSGLAGGKIDQNHVPVRRRIP